MWVFGPKATQNSHKMNESVRRIMRTLWTATLSAAVLFAVIAFGAITEVSAQTINQTMEGSVDIEITHPEELVIGRQAAISILIQNNGWEDKQDISFVFVSQDGRLVAVPDRLVIEKLSQGGSYGSSIDVFVTNNASQGTNFLNVEYSQILVANNETPQDAIFHNIAIPIMLKEKPDIVIHTKAPESIFAAAEFPIEVEVTSDDIDIRDVSVKIIPPDDIGFRGETSHAFSIIKKGEQVTVASRIITPDREVLTEHKLPFGIIVEYTDDMGEQKTDSETISLILRPRVFMELTTEGGIWIGGFFIAPYVSLGTIIGIPAGSLLTLMIRRRAKNKK